MIFDIDGTLVESSGFDGTCYFATISDVLGAVQIHAHRGTYTHVTDTGILRQIMAENGIWESGQIEEIRTKFGDAVRRYLQEGGECLSEERRDPSR